MDETSDDRLIRRLSELNKQQKREITQVSERQNKERKDLMDQIVQASTKKRRRPLSDKNKKREGPDGVALSIGSRVTLLMSGVTGKLGDKAEVVKIKGLERLKKGRVKKRKSGSNSSEFIQVITKKTKQKKTTSYRQKYIYHYR